jgi:hypothetical protein
VLIDRVMIDGGVAAKAIEDDPRRLVAAMATLSPLANKGRSGTFISLPPTGKPSPARP